MRDDYEWIMVQVSLQRRVPDPLDTRGRIHSAISGMCDEAAAEVCERIRKLHSQLG
jgi:hypothetical protein